MSKKRKRKAITPKMRLEVLLRDLSCKTCGRSPVTHHGLTLEVDHIKPFSLDGADDISNYQTLCFDCNRGKGNNEHLNRTMKNDLDAILNYVNPQILKELDHKCEVSVVANQEDYIKITEKNSCGNFYKIVPSTNTLMGFQVGKNFGIYTVHDNSGSKVHFFISKLASTGQGCLD